MLSNQTLASFFVFYEIATLFLEIIYSLVTSAKRETILFLFGCSEVNSSWLITSELANQHARKTLFTCAVYTKAGQSYPLFKHPGHAENVITVKFSVTNCCQIEPGSDYACMLLVTNSWVCTARKEMSKQVIMEDKSVIKAAPEVDEESSSLHDSLGERTTTTAIGKVREFGTFFKGQLQFC